MLKTHKDLEVWQKSVRLVTEVYALTQDFPKSELYGLTNQIRRAAVSVPSNIAEGAARQTNKEFIQFLYIALGSVMELDTQFVIARNLHFTDDESFSEIQLKNEEIGRMLNGLITYRKSKF